MLRVASTPSTLRSSGPRTSSSTTERRSRRRGGCSASTRPRRAAPDCPLRGPGDGLPLWARSNHAGDIQAAVAPTASGRNQPRRGRPHAYAKTKASLNPRVVAHLRDARRGWPSAADTDELGVALRHERWTIWGSASAVSAAPADQFCKSSISAASLSVGQRALLIASVRRRVRARSARDCTHRIAWLSGGLGATPQRYCSDRPIHVRQRRGGFSPALSAKRGRRAQGRAS